MNFKRALKVIIIALFLLLFVFFLTAPEESKDLIVSLAELPGLADTPDKGAFVDLVKAMDEVYTEGKIKIELFPFAHSVNNVLEGKADFHIPTVRNLKIDQSLKPYNTVIEKMGTVYFVIYSNIDKKITKKMLDDAIVNIKKETFPYKIEIPSGIESEFPFPGISQNSVEQGLKKVESKRIDALVWAQEEVDFTLKKLKIKNINRTLWMGFEDAIIIAKGAEGDKMNKLLSDLLKKLQKSGRLEQIYSKIHLPYDDWQPSKMDW
jgi:polar amino acid transport system substrate-binding protein